jgi:DNA repair exonuclease SbcCD ATPase subunit
MKKVIKLKENDIHNIVSILLEQDEDEWVKVSPERYAELMKFAGYYAAGIAGLPEFRGKKIWITGNLNLSNTPTKSLDGIKYIEGQLNINKTQISSIDGIDIKGYVSDWDTPLRRINEKRIKDKKIAEANVRREDDEWRLDTGNGRADDVAYGAHAVLEYIIDNHSNSVKMMTDEDSKRLVELNDLLDNLREKETEYEEQGRDLTDVHADIEVAEDEIEEIGNKMDIYHLIPDGEHYGMPRFEILEIDDLYGEVYCAGTPEQMEDAAYDYVKDQISDEGYKQFNQGFVEDHIDADEVADYFRDVYDDNIRDSPESYFDDDDYELSDEQEARIEEIESLISVLENRLEELEDEIEEPTEYSAAYDEIQERIDTLESEKDEIESSSKELTDEMIEAKIEDLLEDVRRDPLRALEDFGIDDYDRFINERDFIQAVIDEDGIGIINSYDGSYDTFYVNGQEYYVMKIE